MENFGVFVIVGVILRHFHSEHCNYLFGKDYWTTNQCRVERFQHSNPRSLSKI